MLQLVCSGSVPLGTILSSNGAYYTISSKPESASGQCDCASSTGHVSCQVAPKFPINTPQGPAICQSAGQTTCAISSIVSTIRNIHFRATESTTGAELELIWCDSLCALRASRSEAWIPREPFPPLVNPKRPTVFVNVIRRTRHTYCDVRRTPDQLPTSSLHENNSSAPRHPTAKVSESFIRTFCVFMEFLFCFYLSLGTNVVMGSFCIKLLVVPISIRWTLSAFHLSLSKRNHHHDQHMILKRMDAYKRDSAARVKTVWWFDHKYVFLLFDWAESDHGWWEWEKASDDAMDWIF
jgi:hypothetical protein